MNIYAHFSFFLISTQKIWSAWNFSIQMSQYFKIVYWIILSLFTFLRAQKTWPKAKVLFDQERMQLSLLEIYSPKIEKVLIQYLPLYDSGLKKQIAIARLITLPYGIQVFLSINFTILSIIS